MIKMMTGDNKEVRKEIRRLDKKNNKSISAYTSETRALQQYIGNILKAIIYSKRVKHCLIHNLYNKTCDSCDLYYGIHLCSYLVFKRLK
jgi:hypothetical protein